jgi:hypothetical protein
MAIQSATATFVRFYAVEPSTEDFWGYVSDKLKEGSFADCEDNQEQCMGFASWEDLFDSSFMEAPYQKGEYIAFQFRFDQRSVPAIIKKQYLKRKLQDYRHNHEGRWPSRQERMEIQEAVQSWLLNRTLPKPTSCDVVWNPAGKWMLLGATSPKMIDAFLQHFEKYFRLYPVPLFHAQWALNLLPLSGAQKDTLASMIAVRSPQAMYEGRFLGYEFLTWLWFLAETSEGVVRLSADQTIELMLGERLVLTLPADGRERVICTTQANALYEARTALQQGKLVEEIQLYVKVEDNEYVFSLDSLLWALKGLKTPRQLPDSDEEDEDGKFLEKMFFIEQLSGALNGLYAMFLSQRLSAEWESDALPRLRTWIKESAASAARDVGGKAGAL